MDSVKSGCLCAVVGANIWKILSLVENQAYTFHGSPTIQILIKSCVAATIFNFHLREIPLRLIPFHFYTKKNLVLE